MRSGVGGLYFDISDFCRHHPAKKNLKTETFSQNGLLTTLSVTNGKFDASQGVDPAFDALLALSETES